MKNTIILVLFSALAFSGCSLFQSVGTGDPVKDVQVVVAQGSSLRAAMISAANRRRWTVANNADGSYRLTISQRSHRCVVDVVLNGNTSFSILPVESNIPVRKYNQWVNNLQREIIHRAAR